MLQLALDQNFPLPLLRALDRFIRPIVVLRHLTELDPGLCQVDDDQVILGIDRLGLDGLVTTDYHMLNNPKTVAAMVAVKAIVVAIEAAGHDPLRATSALLQELPGLESRLIRGQSNVILHHPRPSRPQAAWEYLKQIAVHQGVDVADLWARHRLQ